MKPTVAVLCMLLLALMGFTAFQASMPAYHPDADAPQTAFSTDRAMTHVRQMAQAPHAVGFPAHREVRDYVMEVLHEMGLKPELQTGYTAGDWGNLSRAENILVRIPGRRPGKALMLMSHYDSNPHSSLGASDAASGVAVILEGLRAYLAGGNTPENDLIVLITDAEELGLNGADVFVNQHPWAGEVGLVLNFEARGSGGPGYMLIETNRGNARLIEEFVSANPKFPVANSLAYSIYKMLPNDTDLTVFREDRDIEGFNFAFIDDHFDYHTALDIPERLDPNTLAHQGSYLVPLLDHFSQADLSGLKSLNDQVYFNLPYLGLVHYSQDLSWPMWVLALLAYFVLLVWGLKKGRLSGTGIAKGFLPMLFLLALNGFAGYFAWPMLKTAYPHYQDLLHGFTYNGYYYIAAAACLAIGSGFWIYRSFKIGTPDVLAAPILLWLVLCAALTKTLPGAAFFLIPGLALLASWIVVLWSDKPNPYVLTALALPALWIFAPFVKMFPVGLGLKMLVAASLMTAFIFLLLLALLMQIPHRKRWGSLGLIGALALLIAAHFQSDFTPHRPKPTSLVYVQDADDGKTYWATYEKTPSDWTRAYLGNPPQPAEHLGGRILSSKYGTGFSFMAEAPAKTIPGPEVQVLQDTVTGASRHLILDILSRRDINRLEVFTGTALEEATVNGIALDSFYLARRRRGKLITHYVSDNEPTRLELTFPVSAALELEIYEASNNLLGHPEFTVPPRPEDQIPMPFVLNDAVLVVKKIAF
ncbi:M28 family peptidase [Robiginitalea sp. M366]|uniref:M28 family peptidase n=1 Tax=Robiginitalea aestuariiviva TaxID=3036903 RepID=UPI00240D35F2|nr:M28 family peptidase [Robiginitalea aestuariiviva]MDG1571229.1 M28 family peptidase [Robiginitalea aestuariiviva]